MAENEKCFCHLNGYKVKDADARAMIEDLENKEHQNADDIRNQGATVEEYGQRLDGVITDVQKHNAQIAALQQAVENMPETPDTTQIEQTVAQHSTQINGIISEQQQHAAKIAKNTSDLTEHKTAYQMHVENNDAAIGDLDDRVKEIEKDHADNTSVVNYLMGLAENPENEGKVYGIQNEEVVAIDMIGLVKTYVDEQIGSVLEGSY